MHDAIFNFAMVYTVFYSLKQRHDCQSESKCTRISHLFI